MRPASPVLARAAIAAALLLGVALLGLGAGWWLSSRTPAPVREQAAAAVTQGDGSVVLARAETAAADAPAAKAPHRLPAGSQLERRGQVTVRPKAQGAAATVDMSLVRLPDDTRRVVASSADGDIIGGIDIPVAALAIPPERRWAAGVYMNPHAPDQLGVWLDRDLGRARVGVELGRGRDDALEARVRVGVQW